MGKVVEERRVFTGTGGQGWTDWETMIGLERVGGAVCMRKLQRKRGAQRAGRVCRAATAVQQRCLGLSGIAARSVLCMDCFRERYPDAGPGVILTPMDELSRRLVEAADVAARAPGWAYAPEVKGLAMRLELFNSLLRQFYIRYRRGLGLTAECRHGLLHCIWCESCFQDLLDDKVSPFRP